ncbi:MAG: shikimate dehydrogenase [Ottowia sp.]|nr:shikimate dehydrogenase [Ottowia sp.]
MVGIARYAVIGNPVSHSQSPFIHTEFARQTGIALRYEKQSTSLEHFAQVVHDFFTQSGCGLNITVPFKQAAYELAHTLTLRAQAAGAVNTLKYEHGTIYADNTDGVGLIRDIQNNLAYNLRGKKICLLGAGGAARGVLLPLLACCPAAVFVANRTASKAVQLVETFAMHFSSHVASVDLSAGDVSQIPTGIDILISASSGSLQNVMPAIAPHAWPREFVYDMVYGAQPSALLQCAQTKGIRVADGLGMLVEQAAESFFFWHGVQVRTPPVLAALRKKLK